MCSTTILFGSLSCTCLFFHFHFFSLQIYSVFRFYFKILYPAVSFTWCLALFFNLVRLSFLWFQFNSVRLGSVPLPISVEGEYAFEHKHRFRGYIIKSIEVWVSGMDFEQPFPSEHSFHTNSQKIHIQISRHRLCLSFIPFERP